MFRLLRLPRIQILIAARTAFRSRRSHGELKLRMNVCILLLQALDGGATSGSTTAGTNGIPPREKVCVYHKILKLYCR